LFLKLEGGDAVGVDRHQVGRPEPHGQRQLRGEFAHQRIDGVRRDLSPFCPSWLSHQRNRIAVIFSVQLLSDDAEVGAVNRTWAAQNLAVFYITVDRHDFRAIPNDDAAKLYGLG
jgi:hypothetical protein